MDQIVTSRSPWLLTGIIAAVLMIAIVVSSREVYFETPILEVGDAAVNALQIDNAKHGAEIYGNYSRFQFNHPGPVLFYINAAGEMILRDWLGVVPTPHNAHLLASLAVQVGCFALALAILHCWFESWFFLAAALLAGMCHFSLVEGAFTSIWPPHVLLMPFLCFLTACCSFAAGRTRELPVMVVLGGVLFHSHVAQPLFVGGLGLLAGFLYWRREKGTSLQSGWCAWIRTHRTLFWFSVSWSLLMLLPLAIDICLYGGESNVATILRRFLLNTKEHKSVVQSVLYFLSFPTYAMNQEDVFTQLGGASFRFFLDHIVTLMLWMLALGGPAWLAWSRRRQFPAPLRGFLGSVCWLWSATVLLCVIWGLLQAGPMFQFNGIFYHGVYYFLLVVGLGILGHFYGAKCPAPVVMVLCCLATIVATRGFRLAVGSNEETGQRIHQGVEAALARTPSHRPVLLVYEHYAWPSAIPVALELQRRGIPFYTFPSWNFMVGRRHDVSRLGPVPETAATIWWITKPAPDGITITKELAIFTEPAPLDPRGAEISFAKQADGFRHVVSGLSTGNLDFAWTEQPRVALLFKPLPATMDVQLILEAQNNPSRESAGPEPADVFFNGVAIGSVTATDRRHHSLTVPQALWNSRPRADLELRFPRAHQVHYFSQPASETWAAWGLWSVSFATTAPSGATAGTSGQTKTGQNQLQVMAELAPTDGRIDFTAAGNLSLYRTSGLAAPGAEETRTVSNHVDLLFRPGKATTDVLVQLVAQPFSPRGASATQHCELFFNDKFIYSAPFIGPGVIRIAVPAQLWNSRPIATISLQLPDAVAGPASDVTAQGLAFRWLVTMPAGTKQ